MAVRLTGGLEQELLWLFVIAVTGIACAALYYAAAGRRVNVTGERLDDASTAHLRLQLREIDADIAAGRLGAAEGEAARAETAREVLRLKSQARPGTGSTPPRALLLAAIAGTAVLALGTYGMLGSPDLPAAPLAERPADLTLEEAVARVEAQLQRTPDDARGWRVVAPVYMQAGRFEDAERAYRRLMEIEGADAELETNLAEAIMMRQGGQFEGEALQLLTSAAERDPGHIRSRYYLAEEATRIGEYQTAIRRWTELAALAEDDETWRDVVRDGLAAARAGLDGAAPRQVTEADIAAMVEGLDTRLAGEGGSIEDWTRLVRSRLVLGQTDLAQAAYEAARAAYPDADERRELDVLAADNGLVAP